MRIRDALAWARERVSYSETPGLDAEVLLAHALRTDRAWVLAHPERVLSEAEEAAYWNAIARRERGEPVAYLTGTKEFFGIELAVDRRVLIPRPETETLVERALAHLPGAGDERVVMDVGTGSGAIAVAIAHARPGARVYATDTSAGALDVAQENARRVLGTSGRVAFVRGALLAGIDEPADVVCANLPYIPTAEFERLPKSVRDYEPWSALDGGADGLDAYRALLSDLAEHRERLSAGAVVLMECDPRQAAALAELARAKLAGASATIVKDLAGDERVVEVVV